MPHLADDDAAWNAVQRRITEVLEPFAVELGPRTCIHGDWADCEDCGYDESQPKEGSMPVLGTWVLTCVVNDAARRDPIVSQTSNPEAMQHEVKGLLHMGLYD